MVKRKFWDAAFSSKVGDRGEHDTPADMVHDLAQVFEWDMDVCASRPNVCEMFYSIAHDGLETGWFGLCWMNPPYGRQIGKWVLKARAVSRNEGTAVVCLLPSRTDTKWWQGNIPFASQVVFIKGRLKFGASSNSAPFPSAFVVFGDLSVLQRLKLARYGWSIEGGRMS